MRTVIVLISGLVLVGCSQTPNSTAQSKLMYDDVYIATVEQAAEQASVDVIWVNPPTKRTNQNN